MTKKPWLKFYTSDWRDARLRNCSLAARGLWIDAMTYMHEAEPYGHLLIAGKSPSITEIALHLARPIGEVKRAMGELEENGVFSKTDDGVIFSRRMVRDFAKAEVDKANGKGGGNPNLKPPLNEVVNPTDNGEDKAQRLEARIQKEKDAANAAPVVDPKTDLFRRGKELLGPNSGGLINKLLKAKGSVPHARAALEFASTTSDAREYIGGCLKGAGGDDLRASGDAW